MNTLLTWWRKATADEKKAVAAECSTTVESIHQMAHAYRTNGVPTLGAGMAVAIDHATGGAVPRKTTCQACAACEYVKP